jgi:hypothetical protein
MTKQIIVTVFFLIMTGCSPALFTSEVSPHFVKGEPLRIAILPFLRVDEKGALVPEADNLLIDNVGFISTVLPRTPSQIIRDQTITAFQSSSYQIVPPAFIDIDLPHRGFAREDGSLDLEKLRKTDPVALCETFLNCDAILYGELSKWSRTYLGIESYGEIALKITLVSGRDRTILYQGTAKDSLSRGITKIPTGISDLFVEPIRGLNSEHMITLSRSMIERLLSPMLEETTSSPQPPPALFAVSHSGKETLSRQEPLIVVAFASEGGYASFSIGKSIRNIPMTERAPGQYYGEYVPLPTDAFTNAPVVVTLTNQQGVSAVLPIAKKNLTLLP